MRVQHGVLANPADHVALCVAEYRDTMRDQIHAFRSTVLRRMADSPEGQHWRSSSIMTEEEIADVFADRRYEDNQRAVCGRF